MDKDFLRAATRLLADADQSDAIIGEHLRLYFLSDPAKAIGQWQSQFDSAARGQITSTMEAAVNWYGLVKVRSRLFELIEEYCYFNEDGDLELKGDSDGNL